MRKPVPVTPEGATPIGKARPSLPVTVLAEDFSLLVRVRRVRVVRGIIRVLS